MEREIKSREREKEAEKRGGVPEESEKKGLSERKKARKERTYRKHPKERENFSEKEESSEEREKLSGSI